MISMLLAVLAGFAPAQDTDGFPGLAAGRAPQVEIAWNRLYDEGEIHELFERLRVRWPELLTVEVIGHSVEGREMRLYTLNDAATGSHETKPAMWMDGNVHGNEVQGAEAVLYTAWYLLENRGHNPRVDALIEGSTFYLLPMVNPDGRASWFADAHTASSSRSGRRPTDDDGDGRFDEDPPDDLDGDGNIVQMRKYTPGEGRFRLDADDPRVLQRVPSTVNEGRGDWTLLGQEGLDNDGDGRLNEDSVGGYDMNRAWPSAWQPDHVQRGAGAYPLYWPETRSIARFLFAHPNVASVQSFHNAGGMILRGPGAEVFGSYSSGDVRVFDELGRDGERMLPFYRYMIIWRDLYSVFGGFATWTYEGLGIISFTNELWNSSQLRREDDTESRGRGMPHFLDDTLLMGAGFVDWHPFEHPLYGEVEIGGFKKDVGRVPPTFMIEEMLHRNALFSIRHAEAMPRVTLTEPEVSDLGDGLWAVDVTLANHHIIPTRTERAAQVHIGRADTLSLTGEGIEVLAGGWSTDRWRSERLDVVEHEPARLLLEGGVRGRSERRARWLVTGSGPFEVRFEAEKARDVSSEGRLD